MAEYNKEEMATAYPQTDFTRHRAVIWVCDIEGSTRGLNDPSLVDATEEFLKRFFWLSAILVRHTGGIVAKWTGDGFLAAYEMSLDRDLGPVAKRVLDAAWHLTLLVNVTQLGIKSNRKFRLRHGVAFEPDAIVVRHTFLENRSTDVIGRGVVLAFRLSGIRAAFPAIVTEKRIVLTVQEHGCSYTFRKLRLSRDDILKYFKGERKGTTEIYASADRKPRPSSRHAIVRKVQKAIQEAENGNSLPPDQQWWDDYLLALHSGPPWSRNMAEVLTTFIRDDLLGTLKATLPVIERVEVSGKS